MANGHAIDRAKNDLEQYHYIFVSFDHKKWHNPPFDSRDIKILKKAIRGNLEPSELSDIFYPKKNNTVTNAKKETEKELIKELIKIELTIEEIMSCTNLDHAGYIWQIKHYMKKDFINEYGKQNLPKYLKDVSLH